MKDRKHHFGFGIIFTIISFTFLAGLAGGLVGVKIFGQDLISTKTEHVSPPATNNENSSKEPIVKEKIKEKIVEKSYLEESKKIKAVKKVSPAVVSIVVSENIKGYLKGGYFFGFPRLIPYESKQKVGGGSGFVISKDGFIVTNKHVVLEDQAEYSVIFQDGKSYPAEIVSRDLFLDIAILKINLPEDAEELDVVELGDSDQLEIGQNVIAIGNALAEYGNTVTAGIISGKQRKIKAGNKNGSLEEISGLLQTDAAINPGNSGGPLISLDGQVIGINTAIAGNAEGIGFAIPVNEIKSVLDSIKKYGEIRRPILGIQYVAIDEKNAEALGLQNTNGAYVNQVVPNGPADLSGIMAGDQILELNGEEINKEKDLRSLVSPFEPGDEIELTIQRQGETTTLKLTLGNANDFF